MTTNGEYASLDFSHMPDVSRADYEEVRRVGLEYAVQVGLFRGALERIALIEPSSGTARLDVTDWSAALDKAQRIARMALDDAEQPRHIARGTTDG